MEKYDAEGFEAHLRASSHNLAERLTASGNSFAGMMVEMAAENAQFGVFAAVLNTVGNRRFLHDGTLNGIVAPALPGFKVRDTSDYDGVYRRFKVEVKSSTHRPGGTSILVNHRGDVRATHLFALVVDRDDESFATTEALYLEPKMLRRYASQTEWGWTLTLSPRRRAELRDRGLLLPVEAAVGLMQARMGVRTTGRR